MVYIVATSNKRKYEDIRQFLSYHNIRVKWLQLPFFPQHPNLEQDAIKKATTAYRQSPNYGQDRIILTESYAVGTSVFCHYDGNGPEIVKVAGQRAQDEALSRYVLNYHSYDVTDLSCRDDTHILSSYVRNGSIAFDHSPADWITNNSFFRRLDSPIYRRLLNFVLNQRGMFLKVWSLNCQKNYWNSSLNAGLPIIRKRDPIHEGTYLLHDIYHFLFLDPVITGSETSEEVQTYIAYRMLSEACTMVLADMIAVADAGLEDEEYDTRARRIYPLFKSLKLNPSSWETVYKVMYANSVYCLKADDSEYLNLGADPQALAIFEEKYSAFFSVDFRWNEKNIRKMLAYARANPFLRLYYENLPKNLRRFNTRICARMVRNEDGTLSFEKLFALFVRQLQIMYDYAEDWSYVSYLKTGVIKYLAGQIYVAFKYVSEKGASELAFLYHNAIDKISASDKTDAILGEFERIVCLINEFIDSLIEKKILLPHEGVLYKLHVPHFPAVYYNYDRALDPDESLAVVTSEILGDNIS